MDDWWIEGWRIDRSSIDLPWSSSWIQLGGFAPQTPHQGGSAPLDPPKYGLVTPQYGGCVQDGLVSPQDGLVMADHLEKNTFLTIFPLEIGCKSRKRSFYVFCPFTLLYRCFRPSRVLQTIELEKIYRFVSKKLNFMAYGSVLSRFCVLYTCSIDFR